MMNKTLVRRWSLTSLLAVSLFGLCFGCSGGNKPIKIRGVVKVDNTPAEDATVEFHPTDASNTGVRSTTVQNDGSFVVSTNKPGDGLFPGHYKVTIRWHAKAKQFGEYKEVGPDKLKGKYSNKDTTTLEYTVSSSNKTPIFELPKP